MLISGSGTRIAPMRLTKAVLSLALAACGMGCLVTEQVDFPKEVNTPPNILADETVPAANRVIIADLDVFRDDAGVAGAPLAFQFAVRDENVEQSLEVRILIRGRLQGDKLGAIPGGQLERTYNFDLQPVIDFSNPGECYTVDVYVSGQFRSEGGATPVIPGDVDSVTWWVSSVDSMHRPVDMTSCPK